MCKQIGAGPLLKICKWKGNGLGYKPPTVWFTPTWVQLFFTTACSNVNKQGCLCWFDLTLWFCFNMYIRQNCYECVLADLMHTPNKNVALCCGALIMYSYKEKHSSTATFLCRSPALLNLCHLFGWIIRLWMNVLLVKFKLCNSVSLGKVK